jgi:hypothetical protein
MTHIHSHTQHTFTTHKNTIPHTQAHTQTNVCCTRVCAHSLLTFTVVCPVLFSRQFVSMTRVCIEHTRHNIHSHSPHSHFHMHTLHARLFTDNQQFINIIRVRIKTLMAAFSSLTLLTLLTFSSPLVFCVQCL